MSNEKILIEALELIISLEGTEENERDAVEVIIPTMCEVARTALAKYRGDE